MSLIQANSSRSLTEIEKAIKEMGLKQIFLLTDRDMPAYNFYKKNGYVEVSNLVPFSKNIGGETRGT